MVSEETKKLESKVEFLRLKLLSAEKDLQRTQELHSKTIAQNQDINRVTAEDQPEQDDSTIFDTIVLVIAVFMLAMVVVVLCLLCVIRNQRRLQNEENTKPQTDGQYIPQADLKAKNIDLDAKAAKFNKV